MTNWSLARNKRSVADSTGSVLSCHLQTVVPVIGGVWLLESTIEAFHMIEVTLTEIVMSLGLALNASYNVIFS